MADPIEGAQSLFDKNSSDAANKLSNNGDREKGQVTSENKIRGFTPESDYIVDNGQEEGQKGVRIPNSPNNSFVYDPDFGFGSEYSTSKYTEYSKALLFDIFNDKGDSFFKYGLYTRLNTEMPVDGNANRVGTEPLLGEQYDHEDPTIYGFEIEIDTLNSPLFNGEIEEFFNHPDISKNSEVLSRLDVYKDFKKQFFRFFIPNATEGLELADDINQRYRLNHYIKKIGGLNNLVINSTSEKTKAFADYRKDVVKLSMTEDVSANVGYLATLYKMLSWSKYNGKMIVPENLLRFDCRIIISEVRNFNRVARALDDPGKLEIIKDNLTRYVYTLNECQLFFEKLPHDDEIDMSAAPGGKSVELFDISLNYKFSTMRMEKFINFLLNNQATTVATSLNENSAYVNKVNSTEQANETSVLVHDPYHVKTMDTNNVNVSNGTIEPLPADVSKVILKTYGPANSTDTAKPNTTINTRTESIESSVTPSKEGTGFTPKKGALDQFKQNTKKRLDQLKKNTVNAFIREANRQILVRAKILNNALEKIRNASGVRRMSNPRNVYFGQQFGLETDIKNAVGSFVGQSLNDLFSSINRGSSTAFYNKRK